MREIFSTLRENVDQVLGGLEDGLLLFAQDGRAVMVSPAVENFLGFPSEKLLGRTASDIFPPTHPLHAALGLSGDQLQPVAAAEVDMENPSAGSAAAPHRRRRADHAPRAARAWRWCVCTTWNRETSPACCRSPNTWPLSRAVPRASPTKLKIPSTPCASGWKI